ncbi:gram-negative bacteria-binding protein 2-like [Drosophila subobscura]|uniref:gram-negative bacteria-binding protein 2-like n=1 Tax=Drosophila subobscura TaxID=7241 RepID=UPI00155A26E4|nr:gram-negative bacteria-binding protein 2-like [Drosophila subobscura]
MQLGLLLLSLAVCCVLGLRDFQIRPQLNYTNNEWVWFSLPEDQRIRSVFFFTDYGANKDPAFNYRVDPNSGHPWAIKEYLNDTLQVSVIVETHQKEIFSGTFKISASEGGTKDTCRVKQVKTSPPRPWNCETLQLPKKFCIKTNSLINDEPCECGERLIFSEQFEDESWRNNWRHLEQSQLPSPNYEGVAFVDHPHNLYVKDNALHLQVTPSNYSKRNPFYLQNCTDQAKDKQSCGSKKPNNNFRKFWPPYNSASIKSIATFKYCRIEIEAKMPIGDWLFPVLSLKSDMGRAIRVAIVRGNEQLQDSAGNEIGGKSLFAGAIVYGNKHEAMRHISIGKHFGEDFHAYTAIWKESSITFKVDGRVYAKITDKSILAQLSESMCRVELAVTVGGEYNFPDSRILSDQKPFRNQHGSLAGGLRKASKKWKHPKLVIRSIRVYSISDYDE